MFKLILFFSICLGLLARVCQLSMGIDYDEAYSFLQYMTQPLLTAVAKYNIPNNHLLNSFIGWVTVQCLGSSPSHLRLTPFIAGVLCLPAIYFCLKSFFGKSAAVFTSCFCFLTWPFVYYSGQARGYIYQILLVYLGFFLADSALKGLRPSRFLTWLAALSFGLALWALPTSIFALAFVFGFLFWNYYSEKLIVFLLGLRAGFIAFLLYFPSLIYVALFGTIRFHQESPFTLEQGFRQLNSVFNVFFNIGFVFYGLLLLPFFIFVLLKKEFFVQRRLFVMLWGAVFFALIIQPDTMNYPRLWIWTMPFLSGFIFSGFSEMSQSLHFRRATWKEVPCLIVFCGLVWTVLPQLPTSPHEKEDHAESLYQDLTRFLREGDYVSLPQAMETELDYWHRVRGATVPFLRFFISGDWHYSVYRLDSDDHKVLRRPLLGSSFYILETKDGDVASGQALFKKLLQTDKLQLEELSVTTKRAKIWKVSQGKKDASEN